MTSYLFFSVHFAFLRSGSNCVFVFTGVLGRYLISSTTSTCTIAEVEVSGHTHTRMYVCVCFALSITVLSLLFLLLLLLVDSVSSFGLKQPANPVRYVSATWV